MHPPKFWGRLFFWGGYRDTDVVDDKRLIDKIEGVIKAVRPEIVFVNYLHDTHQDHRNTASAALSVARHLRNVLFL